ncbi:MAG: terpene cyclase/mutase family protein [Mariniblastus sp.]|nr:terpene cyclase/mutase family protein [Mariniblastus sp.]
MSTYLQDLTLRLATGISLLPEEVRSCHTHYLLESQSEDGGFRGRMGEESDLYYTSFGLRGLSILGALYGEPADRAAKFLSSQLGTHQTIVDFFSLFYAANLLKISAGIDIFAGSDPSWRRQIGEFLARLKRPDGGYAKAPEGHAGSTYHTFLVMLVLQLIDHPIAEPESIISFLRGQQAEGGGWREIRASKRAGTNPSAAAFASLRMIDSVSDETRELTIDFLCEMQTDEGGLRANTRIPIADMLSSFTGGLTLQDMNAFGEIDVDLYQRFVNSLQLPGGGFLAAVWDEVHDVEYTFYGLGCMALIENHRVDQRIG